MLDLRLLTLPPPWSSGDPAATMSIKNGNMSSSATLPEQMAKLQHDAGVKGDVFIGSGDVPKVLSQAAQADECGFAGYGVLPLWH